MQKTGMRKFYKEIPHISLKQEVYVSADWDAST